MSPRELKVLFLSTWLPKPCGIATFSHDLSRAILAANPQTDYRVVAINDPGDAFAYPPVVRQQLDREELASLRKIAEYINASGADVVSLQHEFGLWGGFDGEFILPFLDQLTVPVVATLHAVPLAASTFNRINRLRLLAEIAQRVSHLVTFLPTARDYLIEGLGLDPAKISVIPHGAPTFDRTQRPAARARLAVDDRLVLTTFGLLSRFKGIEDAIRALPPLVAEFPQLVYLVLGRPHPYEPADFYPGLQRLAAELGLSDHVRFVNRFLSDDELADALLATDIYLTPYRDLAQVSSGTLTFALSAGCCCVSTPYLYAQSVLADGRGLLVPPSRPAALTSILRPLLADPSERARFGAAAAEYGETLHWPGIGRCYLDTLAAHALPPRPLPGGRSLAEPQTTGPASNKERSMARLNESELSSALENLSGWSSENGEISKTYTFANFVKAVAFVDRLVDLAEGAGHHPDIDIRYNRVRIALTTHDQGGITELDTRLAGEIDGVA